MSFLLGLFFDSHTGKSMIYGFNGEYDAPKLISRKYT
jgi:hypothetical protein